MIDPGKAAATSYRLAARRLRARAKSAERYNRPLMARIYRADAERAEKAAIVEELDPVPAGLER